MARLFPGCTAELSKRALKSLLHWEEQPAHITQAAELTSRNKQELLSFMQGFGIYVFGGLITKVTGKCSFWWKKNSPCSAIFTSVHSQDVTGSDSFREWLVAFQQLLAVSPCSPTDTCLQIYFEVSRQVKMTIRLKSNILRYFNYRVAQWSPPEGANNISF